MSNEIYNNYDKGSGLTIFFLIDQSGSMTGYCEKCGHPVYNKKCNNKNYKDVICGHVNKSSNSKIQTCTDLLATFYESVSNQKDITLKVMGYSGESIYNRSQNKVESCGLTTVNIDNKKDIGKLNNTIGSTPTHYALREALEKLSSLRGKKMIIVLTDGSPNELVNAQTNDEVFDYNKYLVQKIKGNKIGIFGLLIGNDQRLNDNMSHIFGSDFAQCSNINEASDRLIKLFSKTVHEFILRGS